MFIATIVEYIHTKLTTPRGKNENPRKMFSSDKPNKRSREKHRKIACLFSDADGLIKICMTIDKLEKN